MDRNTRHSLHVFADELRTDLVRIRDMRREESNEEARENLEEVDERFSEAIELLMMTAEIGDDAPAATKRRKGEEPCEERKVRSRRRADAPPEGQVSMEDEGVLQA